jgi:hypothetical protein
MPLSRAACVTEWCVDNRVKQRHTEFRTIGGNYLLVLKGQK